MLSRDKVAWGRHATATRAVCSRAGFESNRARKDAPPDMGGQLWHANGVTPRPRAPVQLLRQRTPAYTTPWGACYLGDCRALLAELPPQSVSLVFTSPPFALRRPKDYGNPPVDEYLDWWMPIANEIHRVLRYDGSFVMELGGAWEPGLPCRSMLNHALPLKMGGLFHECQDFYWHKTRPLPGPIEWVCRRRIRVTEAVTPLWWWANIPEPYCDQRAVLVPYARPLNGINNGHRPSGHEINGHTWHDHGGAIPTNVFTLAPLDGRDPYAQACRSAGATIHPARMPRELPEFFVRLCTRPGQIVLDPFMGSGTTGHVAEELGRRWLGMEVNADYVGSSKLRFGGQGNGVL